MPSTPLMIQAAGTALAVAVTEAGLPVVTHWGGTPGGDPEAVAQALAATYAPAVMHSSFDSPRIVAALPSQFDGWSGTPALELQRGARALPVRLRLTGVEAGEHAVELALADEGNGVTALLRYRIDPAGTLHASVEIANAGDDDLSVLAARLLLPLPHRARELLDTTGRWTAERRPQRGPLRDGAHVRAVHRGRSGHDAPVLEIAGTPGFAFRSGEVWGAHVAWAGDPEHRVERLADGFGVLAAMMGGGELIVPGEVVLAPGERYSSPEVLFVWSDRGIDGLSARLHATVRGFDAYPRSPRPLTLNTWEAVYFGHEFGKLNELAEAAHRIGVERFVLDDGWFGERRHDRIGLGDWVVSDEVWPEGLEPLADRVRELGMQFGLWFEPEMVNLGSRVAQQHPEWILGPDELGPSWRHEYAMNLADPGAYDHVLGQMSELVGRLGIAFIKWDHNRDLHEPVDRRTGRVAVHEQTLAVYRLMDELRARHPGLEIESCASGGGRVDLGIMQHAQRIWASDTNDALERQRIQRWTSVLLPPELIGSHVGPEVSHTTHRSIGLAFRLITSLFAHAGFEWDITECTPAEVEVLQRWAELYKSIRGLIATGETVRADDLPEGSLLHGVVAADGSRAVYAWVQLEVGPFATTLRTPLPGLDPRATYRVEVSDLLGDAARRSIADPAWIEGAVEVPGSVLTGPGVPLPAIHPAQGLLVLVERV